MRLLQETGDMFMSMQVLVCKIDLEARCCDLIRVDFLARTNLIYSQK